MKILISESQLSHLVTEVRNKPEDRDKIYQDENIVVVAPLTHRSSCKYGANTKWCTAVPSNDEYFRDYIFNGVLIYFIIRSPHKESKIPEYKFAYYHAYDSSAIGEQGWYDMSDNAVNDENVDMNLLKFLIPDHIFDLVKEYIKSQKNTWKIRQNEVRKNITNRFMSDPDNINNVIVNNKDWFICYRTKELGEEYLNFNVLHPNPESSITIVFINKKTNKMYYCRLNYYVDLRNFETKKEKLRGLEFSDVFSDALEPKMVKVFEKYYPQILKAYFKNRKEFYSPGNHYTYMSPEYVEIGDELGGGQVSGNRKVSNITRDTNGRYSFDTIDAKGNVSKNVYYSDDVGLGLKYDKEKHNPIS